MKQTWIILKFTLFGTISCAEDHCYVCEKDNSCRAIKLCNGEAKDIINNFCTGNLPLEIVMQDISHKQMKEKLEAEVYACFEIAN